MVNWKQQQLYSVDEIKKICKSMGMQVTKKMCITKTGGPMANVTDPLLFRSVIFTFPFSDIHSSFKGLLYFIK